MESNLRSSFNRGGLWLKLEAVRPFLPNYRGWMNPTQVNRTLLAMKKPHVMTAHLKTMQLCEGINRIQWEGSWLNPGVPPAAAYKHTHWVAHFQGWVLCTACTPYQWISVENWKHFHLECEPRSPFHITHHYTLSVKPIFKGDEP